MSDHDWVEITPQQYTLRKMLREVWNYRGMAGFLTWRDVKVRYKQTLLGAAWVVLQPLMTMAIFTLFFGRLAKIPSDGIPYAIWSYAGLTLWTYFSTTITNGANSLVANQNLIKKVYFPRLVIPISTVLAALVDLSITFALFIAMTFYYRIFPGIEVLFAPVFMGLMILLAIGTSFWVSALNVSYRDVRYVVPFMIQFLMFSSPIAYPSSIVPREVVWGGWHLPARDLYALNPLVGIIDGFRWSVLGTEMPGVAGLAISVSVTLVILVSGLYFFMRAEKTFADIV